VELRPASATALVTFRMALAALLKNAACSRVKAQEVGCTVAGMAACQLNERAKGVSFG